MVYGKRNITTNLFNSKSCNKKMSSVGCYTWECMFSWPRCNSSMPNFPSITSSIYTYINWTAHKNFTRFMIKVGSQRICAHISTMKCHLLLHIAKTKKFFIPLKWLIAKLKYIMHTFFLSNIIFRQMFSFVESSNIECAD